MANRELNVVLGLKLGEFQAGLMKAEKQLKRFGDNMARTGRELTQSLTLPILGVGAGAIKAFTDIERLEKGLAAVMGSSEAAAIELRNLQEVAKLPGLGFEEAVQGSIRLQAVGLSANEARETLSAFGAAIAATGGTAQNLESVQYQLTQMISKNRILQEDFGIIQENVPLVGKAIEAAFGTRNVEQIRATGISAQEFNRRIVEALRTLPETQAAVGGLGNAFENFGDSVKVSFAELGRSINTALNLEGVLDGLANVVQNVIDYFKGLSPEAQRFIVISAAVVAAIGPMMFIFGQLISLGSKLAVVIRGIGIAFTIMTGPIGLTIAAIAAVALAIIQAYKQFEGFRKVINGLIDTWLEFIKIFAEGAKSAFTGISKILKGDIIDGFKDLGSAFIKTNPIGAWATQGKRLAGAFADGYADETNRLEGVFSKLKNFASSKGITDVSGTGLPITPTAATGGLDPSFERMKNFKPIEIIRPETPLILQQTNTQIQQNTQAISDYKEMITEASLAIENQTKAQERANKENMIGTAVMESMQAISNSLVDSFFSALESGQNVIKSLIGGLKQLVIQLVKTIAKAVIFAGIMALIPGGSLIGKSISGLGGLVGKGSFLKNLLGGALPFANGGLVTGPTLGLIGEGRGTSMSNPEVVAPLDKLRSILDSSMGGGQFVASTRLQGSDLLLVVERAERNRGR
jgi:tape measure domain-containing protein